MSLEFLNIDFDLKSKNNINLLVGELKSNLVVMNEGFLEGHSHYSFELAGLNGDEQYLLDMYFSIFNDLSEEAKMQWKSCETKNFDFGYEGHLEKSSCQIEISDSMISKMNKMGASFTVTLYKSDAIE
ncbi:hypothetical protein OE749_12435 [Aestuariibacter sp. AA17]|uniref:Uncharacterized protein n=1 Tax=Fluctibacter corallii TaxID=2984329 RepID=A0ABT3AA05_9ALTE|nr:hypothetical protein [Aestuariibacter sp. AA17]MCV2885503.1 hypothetical protein [Aestuariibacter sp. AA17]